MTRAARHKDPRVLKLSALFAEAAKRDISAEELREKIAPRELGMRLSVASEADIAALMRYIKGEGLPPSQIPEAGSMVQGPGESKYDRPLMSGFRERYDELGYRDGMATPPQLRMIEGMWMDVSNQRTYEDRLSALDSFLKRVVKVDSMRFVEGWMVSKVIAAIRRMKPAMR